MDNNHFGEDKTKSILFASKIKRKNIKKPHVKYGDMQIKQHSKFKYVGCLLDETMSGKAIALNIVNIIHNKPKSVYCKINFLMPVLRRLLCNALIQPHFDYACSSCYPNLTKKLNIEFKLLKTSVCIFLQLDKLKNIPHEEFKCLNWLPVTYRYKRCVNAIVF